MHIALSYAALPISARCGARDLKDLKFFGAKWDLSEYYSQDPSDRVPGWSRMTWWNFPVNGRSDKFGAT